MNLVAMSNVPHPRGGIPAGGEDWLFGHFYTPRLADDGDLDLAGILERVLDLERDVAGEGESLLVVDLLRLDEHAKFAARLDGKTLFHARE